MGFLDILEDDMTAKRMGVVTIIVSWNRYRELSSGVAFRIPLPARLGMTVISGPSKLKDRGGDLTPSTGSRRQFPGHTPRVPHRSL